MASVPLVDLGVGPYVHETPSPRFPDAIYLGSEGAAPPPTLHPDDKSLRASLVDVGGQMSHAVIVAREFGMPCVVAATDATRRIPDGARVRVDGAAGTVTMLG